MACFYDNGSPLVDMFSARNFVPIAVYATHRFQT